jgi:polyketide biosynthesis acyl carrier protein
VGKNDIFEIVRRNTSEILGTISAADVQMNVSLKSYGANSIDRMDIVIKSMEDVGVKIPLVELGKVSNIQGLVDVLFEAQKSAL